MFHAPVYTVHSPAMINITDAFNNLLDLTDNHMVQDLLRHTKNTHMGHLINSLNNGAFGLASAIHDCKEALAQPVSILRNLSTETEATLSSRLGELHNAIDNCTPTPNNVDANGDQKTKRIRVQ